MVSFESHFISAGTIKAIMVAINYHIPNNSRRPTTEIQIIIRTMDKNIVFHLGRTNQFGSVSIDRYIVHRITHYIRHINTGGVFDN